MLWTRAAWLWQVVLAMFIALNLGCASARVQESPSSPAQREGGETGCGWWYARFGIDWPQGNEPRWPVDLLLAHRLVYPVVQHWQGDIKLWRIHRRAARDQAGHQFSFLFYSSPETARRIFDFIRNDMILTELKSKGLIVRDAYDDTSEIKKPNIEDTCDPRWSIQIQKSWPYFAMGASQMWLNLIVETAKTIPDADKTTSSAQMLEAYRRINDAIKSAWQDEGSHAFLHHLNAIFGYEPIMVLEKRMVTF